MVALTIAARVKEDELIPPPPVEPQDAATEPTQLPGDAKDADKPGPPPLAELSTPSDQMSDAIDRASRARSQEKLSGALSVLAPFALDQRRQLQGLQQELGREREACKRAEISQAELTATLKAAQKSNRLREI